MGSSGFLPSDEVSSTLQITDDFTKIFAKHTFKMGLEFQRAKFSTLQPPVSRGDFHYGVYTDIPNLGGGNTGRAQFLLTPIAATVANGVDYVIVHTGFDERHEIPGLSPLDDLDAVTRAVSVPVQAVGGLTVEQIMPGFTRRLIKR